MYLQFGKNTNVNLLDLNVLRKMSG
jgi:hypothetical protein